MRVAGPEAASYLDRLLSNDVRALEPGAACDALLLTPKARVIAHLRVLRRTADDFLLLTEPELAGTVRDHLVRMRFAARVEVELERHASHLLLGGAAAPPAGATAVATSDYALPGYEVLDADPPADAEPLAEEELERLRILAGTPRHGRELDDRALPAETGLVERAVSFTKGCYPGQEPVARLHYRGHANRALRVLRIEADAPPPYDAEIRHDGRAVGRVTSAVRTEDGVLALGYVRSEVPPDARLSVEGAAATMAAPERP